MPNITSISETYDEEISRNELLEIYLGKMLGKFKEFSMIPQQLCTNKNIAPFEEYLSIHLINQHPEKSQTISTLKYFQYVFEFYLENLNLSHFKHH